jgi:hypothetical protein
VESLDLRPSNQYILVSESPSCLRLAKKHVIMRRYSYSELTYLLFSDLAPHDIRLRFKIDRFMLGRLCGLWSEFLATVPEVQVRFPALPDFLRSNGPGTGSTQPREYN